MMKIYEGINNCDDKKFINLRFPCNINVVAIDEMFSMLRAWDREKKSESSTGFEPMTSLMWMGEVPTGLSKYYFETLSDLTAQRNYLSQG